jgi:ferrous iron transport protein B
MKEITIALVGQPNVGKSMLINTLSGANLKVGNFSGCTVDKAEACLLDNNRKLKIIDLPGTYSINDFTQEEKVTKEFLENGEYDIILNVIDSTKLERNLYLTGELMELNKKMVVALNMSDEADKEGIIINSEYLSEILGIPCIKVSAAKNFGTKELLCNIYKTNEHELKEPKRVYHDAIEGSIEDIEFFLHTKGVKDLDHLGTHKDIALALLKENKDVYQELHEHPIWLELHDIVKFAKKRLYLHFETQDVTDIFLEDVHAFARGAATDAIIYRKDIKENLTRKIDSILIHKYFGIPIFLFFMWGLFQLTFEIGSIPMDWIDGAISSLSEALNKQIPNESFRSLLVDGIIAGVGAVLLFVPNIVILFFGIAMLETTGYMSRVAFLLDGFFHKFGLHGKSFIPLVTGFGCSVPAYMAARTLKNNKDRLLTMFIIGFMSCGAKLPVYVLFVGAFFPAEIAGNVLFGIYIFGALIGIVFAKLLRVMVFKGEDEPFVMEMPKYRMPSGKLIFFMVYNKAKMYVKKAGTYILAASMIIWFASTYPKNDLISSQYETKIEKAISQDEKDNLTNEMNLKLLESSYLGMTGKFIEPVLAPMDFDWRLSVSLVTGLAAKEVIVATLGVLYAIGDDVDESSEALMNLLRENISLPTAVAFIMFVIAYLPCLAATSVFHKEAGDKKYTYYLLIFTNLSAYVLALIGYFITSLIV